MENFYGWNTISINNVNTYQMLVKLMDNMDKNNI